MRDTQAIAGGVLVLRLADDKYTDEVVENARNLPSVITQICDSDFERTYDDKRSLALREYKMPPVPKFTPKSQKILCRLNSSIAFVERALQSDKSLDDFLETIDGANQYRISLLAASTAALAEAQYKSFPKTAKMGKAGVLDRRTLASIFPLLTYDRDGEYHEHSRLYDMVVPKIAPEDELVFDTFEQGLISVRYANSFSSFFG